jgi:hypothetical protein
MRRIHILEVHCFVHAFYEVFISCSVSPCHCAAQVDVVKLLRECKQVIMIAIITCQWIGRALEGCLVGGTGARVRENECIQVRRGWVCMWANARGCPGVNH